MIFRPTINDTITIEGRQYRFVEHPSAPGMVYAQQGRRATVYKLVDSSETVKALKVFLPHFREPRLIRVVQCLQPYASLPGLQACERMVLTTGKHGELLKTYPDLDYAFVMPWVDGPTWMETILGRDVLAPERSIKLAHGLARLLVSMEEQGLAHCDISGTNIILAPNNGKLALIDLEEMFGPDFQKPEELSSGSSGYGHASIARGVWDAQGDRFAGAVVLAEILGWCEAAIRDASWDESYFDPKDIHQKGDRYTRLFNVLSQRWGGGVAALFERAWTSKTLSECPTFAEWLVALPQETPVVIAADREAPAVSPGPHPQPVQPEPNADAQLMALVDLAQRLIAAGNLEGAKTAYAQVLALASKNSQSFKLAQVGLQGVEALLLPPPPTSSDPFTATVISDSAPDRGAKPKPIPRRAVVIPGASRGKNIWTSLGLFIGAAVVLFILIMIFSYDLAMFGNSIWRSGGNVTLQALVSAALSAIIGAVQAWVFRLRMRPAVRWQFMLLTALGGLIGGILAGILMNSYVRFGWIGFWTGATAGLISSLMQNWLLKGQRSGARWVFWNLFSWPIIWGLGYSISRSIGYTEGTATGSGFIVLAIGASLALFLRIFPDIEF